MSPKDDPTKTPIRLPVLDFGAILHAVWLPLLLWCVMVIGAAMSGYPGVVCVTPLAWLLALPVGRSCVLRSRSPRPTMPLLEAGLAGGLLGALEGLIVAPVGVLAGDLNADDQTAMILIGSAVSICGLVVCAALAVALGAVQQRRLRS